jgi:hypothetical protein
LEICLRHRWWGGRGNWQACGRGLTMEWNVDGSDSR